MAQPLRMASLHSQLRALLVLVMLAGAQLSWAQQPPNVTAGELALLPVYCPYTQTFAHDPRGTNPTAESTQWVQTMGKSFWGLHHYCWALIRLQRARAAGPSHAAKMHHWSSAVNDLTYVIQNATADFVLLPEIYQRMGETYLQMGSPGSAVLVFNKSRELKPDYWPPYVAWADALVKLGLKREARAYLEDGLRLMPQSPQLLSAYRRQGGDPTRFLKSLPPPNAPAAASGPSTGSRSGSDVAPAASAPAPTPASSATAS